MKKKSIPDDILWKMCKTGVPFSMLSDILKLAFSVVGEDTNFFLSASHLFKRYQKLAAKQELAYKSEIRANKSLGTICFDHQKMKQLSGKYCEKEDRLALLWHSNFVDKLLSIDKMPNKTGTSQFRSIKSACESYEIESERIVALTCDNAITNTGNENGTCSLLEADLFKDFLRLMCRHHILEIMLKCVYKLLFKSGAPTNVFHLILSERWSDIKNNSFIFNGFDDINAPEDMNGFDEEQFIIYDTFKEQALLELQTHSTHKFTRDDYKEITNLCLKCLNGQRTNITKSNQTQFNTLQNPSHARFMSSAIQGIKCFLFRDQLDWESNERVEIIQILPNFCQFLSLIYVRYWNRSNILFDAGINDLTLLKDLETYVALDASVSNTAIDALSRHLYYLGEELIVLSLFSEKLSAEEKNEMARKLTRMDFNNIPERNYESNHIKFNDFVENWHMKQIADFIGDRSLYIFQLFDISMEFLDLDAIQWITNPTFLNAKLKISAALVCVNDATERVISTCKYKYKRQRCKNEESFHRSMFEGFISSFNCD